MNYPVWDTGLLSGGLLIALIAVPHVLISHLAVGGGLFIWWLDRLQMKTGDLGLNEVLRRYKKVFLLVSMVFGGVTGVGIWFIIALVQPAGTSLLIHNYVFGWAMEWVCFLGEIVALLVYHYRFDQLERRFRNKIAAWYFVFAWGSLLIISGIISFMLTPGEWLQTHDFWDGFLNPTFAPSVFFRTFVTFMWAGAFAVLVAAFEKDDSARTKVSVAGSNWILVGLAGAAATGWWYWHAIPLDARHTNFVLNPEGNLPLQVIMASSVGLMILGAFMATRVPRRAQLAVGIGLAIVGQAWMGGFEYAREFARRPYVVRDVMYSNGLTPAQVDEAQQQGFFASARWVPQDAGDEQARGQLLFRNQCMVCHTVGGRNDIVPLTERFTFMGMKAMLTGQGKVYDYMPPFAGDEADKDALAAWIVGGLHGKPVVREPEAHTIVEQPFDMPQSPTVAEGEDEYVLLAWNDLGMHCLTDQDAWFSLLPPANTLEAQLIKRGDAPSKITEGVTLSYTVEQGYEKPQDQVPFWEHAGQLYGAELEPGTGLSGNPVTGGTFAPKADTSSFIATAVPVTPYKADGTYNPYPLFTVEARDDSGKLLAQTKMVAPVSTEFGCRNCHGGDWARQGAGISEQTARNLLDVHDHLSGTDLLAQAEAGNPQRCQACHADPAVGAEGDGERMSLSASVHGFHANLMGPGAESCAMCHPAHPQGQTRCLRGVHASVGQDCTSCHGTMQEHALGLLNRESEQDKAQADVLSAALEPSGVASADLVAPRDPWLGEPQCTGCHAGFQKPAADASGLNSWKDAGPDKLFRMSTDWVGLRCEACHGSTHAIYPAQSPYGGARDVIQPMQYQGNNLPISADQACTVCHFTAPPGSAHHPNHKRDFRHRELIQVDPAWSAEAAEE